MRATISGSFSDRSTCFSAASLEKLVEPSDICRRRKYLESTLTHRTEVVGLCADDDTMNVKLLVTTYSLEI